MSVFEEFAPRYWGAGLQAIPLAPGQKRPIPNQWSKFNTEKIPEAVQASWLESYPSANIGVVPGPISNVCFVDLDIDDPVILAEVEAQLPHSPWRRVGKKGCVLAYKWCDAKSFKIFEAEGTHPGRSKIGFEFFCSSGQVVMPPSIHPDTHAPYTANVDLWNVIDKLEPIDGTTLEAKMREFFGFKKIKVSVKGRVLLGEHVSRGTRDVTMVRLAGLYAQMIRRGECTLKEALDYMDVWGSEFVEDIAGDQLDIRKGKIKIVSYLVKDVHDRKAVLPKGWDAGLDDELRSDLDLGQITAEDVSFDYSEIVAEFDERMRQIEAEAKPEAQFDRLQTVEKSLRRIARSTSVSDLETDALLTYIQNRIGKNVLKMGTLTKGLKKQKASSVEGMSHKEIADDFIRCNDEIEMRFDRGALWEWMGSYWSRKDSGDVIKKIINEYGDLPAAKKATDHTGIYKTICNLLMKPIKTTAAHGINFTNGFLDTDLRLTPHSKEHGLVYELPYSFEPDLGEPKMFLKFIRDAWPEDWEAMGKLIQEALAVTMFGIAPKYQRCFLMYGVAHSGKSVMMDVLGSLFPPEAQTAIPPDKWNEKFITGELDGPLLNLAGELPEAAFISSQIFKQMVNGEQLCGEHKNKDPFQFRPVAAHWFASNHLPKSKDTSTGFTRRWIILPFLHVVPENQRNVNLAEEIILAEREAIVAWAVRAIGGVVDRGYIEVPKLAEEFNAELGANLNPIRVWFNDRIESCTEKDVLTDEQAYTAFCTFALQKGYRKLDRGLFKATMRELAGNGGFETITDVEGSQKYIGIRIKKR